MWNAAVSISKYASYQLEPNKISPFKVFFLDRSLKSKLISLKLEVSHSKMFPIMVNK